MPEPRPLVAIDAPDQQISLTDPDSCMHCGDVAEANDVRCEVGWSFRQAGLPLQRRRGCLSLSCRREADLSHDDRAGRQDDATLLDGPKCPLKSKCTTGNERRIPRR